MASSFGEQLRLAREARGITLREISEQTRISMRHLEAIESNDYKRLPGGIFNRSFIKAYARQVGFDQNEALEGYARTARELGESPDDVQSTPHQSRVYTDAGSNRSPFVTVLLSVVILAILSLGVYALSHWITRKTSVVNDAPPANVAVPQKNGPSASPSPALAADGFNVQVKPVGETVWVRVYLDDDAKAVLAQNVSADQTKEFKPTKRARIQFVKVHAGSLEISVNGRPVKIAPDSKGTLAEITVDKDDYEKHFQ
jgi:cytoskeleton protein RodZ